jgi:hypothetical protein
MFHVATQRLAWLVSDRRTSVRRKSVRATSAHTKPPQASGPSVAEDVLSGAVLVGVSVLVIVAVAWMALEITTDLARFQLIDLMRGMTRFQ